MAARLRVLLVAPPQHRPRPLPTPARPPVPARSRSPLASVAVEQRAAPSERVYYGSFELAVGGYLQYHSYGGEPAASGAPSPPSPPRSSSWDFFNMFGDYGVYDNYC